MALYFGDQLVSLTSVNSSGTAPTDVIQHADIPDYVKVKALSVATKGVINIAKVTGDVIITAAAVKMRHIQILFPQRQIVPA